MQWVRAFTIVAGSVLVLGYYLSSGRWHPRVVHDGSGRAVLFAELAPAPRTFGGVALGMTSEQLLRAKGKPVQEAQSHWMYNSIDSAHDGVLDVYLAHSGDRGVATVWAVLFWGKPDAEPPGMANMLGFTRQDLVLRYGAPARENDGGRGSRYLYFRNGIMVWLETDKVSAYGVYSCQ